MEASQESRKHSFVGSNGGGACGPSPSPCPQPVTYQTPTHTPYHNLWTQKINSSSYQATNRKLHAAPSLTSAASTWSKLESKSENYTITMRTLCCLHPRPTRSALAMKHVVSVLAIVVMLLVAPRSGASSFLSRGKRQSRQSTPLILVEPHH